MQFKYKDPIEISSESPSIVIPQCICDLLLLFCSLFSHIEIHSVQPGPEYISPDGLTLRPRQNGRHFANAIFKSIFVNENIWILIKISLEFVLKGSFNNIPALVQIMAWCRPDDKPLSEPVMVNLPTHMCVTRPQWVKRFAEGVTHSRDVTSILLDTSWVCHGVRTVQMGLWSCLALSFFLQNVMCLLFVFSLLIHVKIITGISLSSYLCVEISYAAVTPRRVALTCVQRVVKFCHTIGAQHFHVLRTFYTFGERSNASWLLLTR